MASITDIKCALSQKNFDIFCSNFHIPEEVHPQLPSRNQTIHEMPAGKIGLYTRFFEFANFRLPLSSFLVDILRYYRIHISQLSVIAAAKISHFKILCRVNDFPPTVGLFRCFYLHFKKSGWMSFSKRPGTNVVCYTKPIDFLKGWNDRFFWVDSFACPALFPWHSNKNVPKDPLPKYSEFNAEHYASLVSFLAPFYKYPKPFLCLIGLSRRYTFDEDSYPVFLEDDNTNQEMSLFNFIRTADPSKVKIVERQRAVDEPTLLSTTVGRIVPLLPIAPARTEGELEDSVDKLFSEESGDGRTDQEPDWGYDVYYSFRSSVSATPEREGGGHTGSVAGPGLQTTEVPQRFVISSDSSHHSGTNPAEAKVNSFTRSSAHVMTTTTTITAMVDVALTTKETTWPSVFAADSSSAGGTEHALGGFSNLIGDDFVVGDIRTVVDPDSDLQKVYVSRWSVTNGSRLDNTRECREMVDEFAPSRFFASIRGMEHDQLFGEFNMGLARQLALGAEAEAAEAIRLRAEVSNFQASEQSRQSEVESLKERNAAFEREKSTLGVKVPNLAATVKVREQEAADLDAVVTSVRLQNDRLIDQVCIFTPSP
ncbi:hypothetical protein Tco_0412248 [Tanacetum coccineum]